MMIKAIFLNRYVLSLLFLGVNLLVYGYEYGNNSYHDYLLPYINKIIDPFLYPGDSYLLTLGSFPSLYIYAMGALGKIFPLEGIHFFVYLIAKYLLFLAVYNLSFFLFKNTGTAVLTVFLFTLSPLVNAFGLLGDEAVMKTLLYQTTLSVPFLLITLTYFLKKRYLVSLPLLASLYYINSLSSFHLTVILLTATFALLLDEKGRNENKALIKGWLVFLALALPYLFWSSGKTSGLSSCAQFMLYLKNYYAGHYFPSSWDAAKILKAASFISLFLLFIFQSPADENKKKVTAFVGGIFLLWLAALIFSEFIPLRIPTVLMPFRSDLFFIVIGLCYAAGFIQRFLFSPNITHPIVAMLLTLVLTDIQLFTPSCLTTLCGFFLIFFANQEKDVIQNGRFKKLIQFLYTTTLAFVFVISLSWLFLDPLKFKSYLLVILALTFLLLSQKSALKPAAENNRRLYLFLIIIVALLPSSDLIAYRIKNRQLSFTNSVRADWKDIQLWVENNTPQNSLFVVPPYINGFRSFSKRPVFVEKIDGGAMHWHPGYELLWAEKLQELGFSEFPLLQFKTYEPDDPLTVQTQAVYARNDKEKFLALKQKYGLDYVVTENKHQLPFPLVYQNDHFSLYDISRQR